MNITGIFNFRSVFLVALKIYYWFKTGFGPGSKFSQFHAVIGKFWRNRMLPTTPSGSAWIRHCLPWVKSLPVIGYPEIGNANFKCAS